MNQEQTHKKEETLERSRSSKAVKLKDGAKKIKSLKLLKLFSPGNSTGNSNTHQTNSPHQPLWFWNMHYRWSFLRRSLFWGGVIGFTAISSAGLGAALTKIDRVESAIARGIQVNSLKQLVLDRPMNVLVIEVKPNKKNINIVEFSDNFFGSSSKTILLLKFNPQDGLAEIINIPADTRVKIPGFGWGTIADAHKHGGTSLVSQMVNQLLPGETVDRYLRATPKTFHQLTASGKLTLRDCNFRITDCEDQTAKIIRQEENLEAIRQRLHVSAYLNDFQITATELKPNLDTNISVPELIALANFVKELDSDHLGVSLLPGYVPGKNNNSDNQHTKPKGIKSPTKYQNKLLK